MANTKISALPAGNPAQTTDQIPVARSGANNQITAASIAALAAGTPLYTGAGWPTLPNLSTTPLFSSNVGSGDTDLYTVPAGKKAIIFGQAWNSTASSVSFYCQIKLSGTYFPTVATQSLANTAAASLGLFSVIVLEAGQVFSIHTSAAGLNLVGTIYTFDNTANIKSALITTFINGNNAVYTCPVGKTAYLYGHINNHNTVASAGSVQGYNNTGGSLTYHWNYVPNGGSAGTSNQIAQNITAAAGAGTPASFGLALNTVELAFTAGDSLSVNSTSSNANQLAWINIVEQSS